MARYKIKVSYDGAPFSGFQRQPHLPTVQGHLEEALSFLSSSFVSVAGASRTDAGVHALGQIAHFDLIPPRKPTILLKALNARLPLEIRVLEVEEVAEDFHARFDSTKKIYTYTLSTSPFQSPFNRHNTLHFPYPLHLEAIYEACEILKGTHDFQNFANLTTNPPPSSVRTIFELSCALKGELLVFTFCGNGFLYNMVRNLVGALLKVGRKQLSLTDLKALLVEKWDKRPFTTMPAHALCLKEVFFS